MNWNFGANATMKAATEFPAEFMKKYAGNSLTKIKVGIGADTGIKSAKVFLSYKKEDRPFYSQDVLLNANGWNEITLDTPYQIEDKDLCIGYSLTSGNGQSPSPISTDQEPGTGRDYLALPVKGGGVKWYKASEAGVKYNLCIKAVVEGSSLPQYEYTFENLIPQKAVLSKNEKATLKGTLKNLGAQVVKSFDFVYQAGDAAPVIVKVKDLNINSTDRYNFTVKDLAVNPDNCTTFNVTLNNFNELADAVPATSTLTTSVLCPGEKSVVRKVLLENFTTDKCTACPFAHTELENAVGNNENIIWIAHHAGFSTDNYTIPQSKDYLWFYNNGSKIYAPSMMLDRSDFRNEGAQPEGASPVSNVNEAIAGNMLKASLEIPAYATVAIEKEYDKTTRKLVITIRGNALYGKLPGSARVNVYLTENGIIGTQQGASNSDNYEHDHVIRAVLTDVWGDVLSFDTEGNYSAKYSCTLNDEWVSDNMDAVAFLSSYDPKDVFNCPVFNSEKVRINPLGSNIDSSKAKDSARVSSTNSRILINGEFSGAVIFDPAGKIIETLSTQKESSELTSGVYFVKITNNQQTIVKKIAVK